MEIRIRATGEVIDENQVAARFPETSWPAASRITAEMLVGCDVIQEVAEPVAGIHQSVTRDGIEQANGVWQQKWAVRDWTAEEIAAYEQSLVPREVTMRQARLALFGAGMLASVESAIDALNEPNKTAARIEWDHSQTVQRGRGLVVQLGTAMGLSSAQIDALFVAAAAL